MKVISYIVELNIFHQINEIIFKWYWFFKLRGTFITLQTICRGTCAEFSCFFAIVSCTNILYAICLDVCCFNCFSIHINISVYSTFCLNKITHHQTKFQSHKIYFSVEFDSFSPVIILNLFTFMFFVSFVMHKLSDRSSRVL